jgi:chromosome segregation ATPase
MQITESFGEKGNIKHDYKKELESVQDQILKLLDYMEENREKRKETQEQKRVTKAVIEHPEKELRKLSIKSKILKEKADEAQKETSEAEEEYNGLKEVVENLKIMAKKQELEAIIKRILQA